MAIRIQHPEHGYHNVYSQMDLENHMKAGWSKVIEKAPETVKPVEAAAEAVKNVELPPIESVGEYLYGKSVEVVEPVVEPVAKEELFKCEVCGKTYKFKMHLAMHKRKHKG